MKYDPSLTFEAETFIDSVKCLENEKKNVYFGFKKDGQNLKIDENMLVMGVVKNLLF